MSLIKIDKGKITALPFKVIADTLTANASVSLPYEALKISLLKKKGDKYNKKDIFSLLSNLLVKNNNKAEKKCVRQI
jgi:hypothetical protein